MLIVDLVIVDCRFNDAIVNRQSSIDNP